MVETMHCFMEVSCRLLERWILNSNLWVMPRQQHQGSLVSNVFLKLFYALIGCQLFIKSRPSHRWCSCWSLGIFCGHGGTWVRDKTKSPGALPIRSLGCREGIHFLPGGSKDKLLELASQELPQKWCNNISTKLSRSFSQFHPGNVVGGHVFGIFLSLTAVRG